MLGLPAQACLDMHWGPTQFYQHSRHDPAQRSPVGGYCKELDVYKILENVRSIKLPFMIMYITHMDTAKSSIGVSTP